MRTFSVLVVALVLGGSAGCWGGGDDDGDSATPDAAPPEYPLLGVRTLAVGDDDVVADVAVSPDGKTLAYCTLRKKRFGLVDIATWQVRESRDLLAEYPQLKGTADCYVNVFGDSVFVTFNPWSGFGGVPFAGIVKLSLETGEPAALWPLPDMGHEDWGFEFHGLAQTSNPDEAVVLFPRSGVQAIQIYVVNLKTGTFEDRMVAGGGPGTQYTLELVNGKFLLGEMLKAPGESFMFLVNIEDSSFVWQSQDPAIDVIDEMIAIEPKTMRLIVGRVPSAGWGVIDLAAGTPIDNHEYRFGAFRNNPTFLPGNRVAMLQAGSNDSWIYIHDIATGVPIATTESLPAAISYGALSLDEKHLYAGASGVLLDVDLSTLD